MSHRHARISRLTVGIVAAAALVACTNTPAPTGEAPTPRDATPSAATAAPATPLLDGNEKSIVLVGYSTSYAWPEMLQELLDEHAGGRRTYHLLNAVIGGSPVGRWIAEPGSDDYEATYGAMQRDFFGPDARLRGEVPPPTVALMQQSLQRTPTPETRLGPVSAAHDERGVEIGADALEKLSMQLRDDGVERIYIGMHIYKEGYEPEVGNERFALDALLRRGHPFIFEGPDVWSLTLRQHPAAFTEDRLHPNERGAKLMAAAWYRALAGAAARDELIGAMDARRYDIDAMMDAYLEWRQ